MGSEMCIRDSMSAVLVAGLLALALPALQGLFNQAISQVSQGG